MPESSPPSATAPARIRAGDEVAQAGGEGRDGIGSGGGFQHFQAVEAHAEIVAERRFGRVAGVERVDAGGVAGFGQAQRQFQRLRVEGSAAGAAGCGMAADGEQDGDVNHGFGRSGALWRSGSGPA